jgi:hypothetical protein
MGSGIGAGVTFRLFPISEGYPLKYHFIKTCCFGENGKREFCESDGFSFH